MTVLYVITFICIIVLLIAAIYNVVSVLSLLPYKYDPGTMTNAHLSRSDLCQELVESVDHYYHDLIERIRLVMAIAPNVGLFFTVIGLITTLYKQSNGVLDHAALLGDMGVALGSTACSSLILMGQLVLYKHISQRVNEEYALQKALLDASWGGQG